jgi:hypothetical protein
MEIIKMMLTRKKKPDKKITTSSPNRKKMTSIISLRIYNTCKLFEVVDLLEQMPTKTGSTMRTPSSTLWLNNAFKT